MSGDITVCLHCDGPQPGTQGPAEENNIGRLNRTEIRYRCSRCGKTSVKIVTVGLVLSDDGSPIRTLDIRWRAL
jgi:hypothetical protein